MQCIEGCGLPVLRELTGLCETVWQRGDEDHEHGEGCGHSQISHGDHTDWLVPLKDGSFKLSHQQVQNGRPSFIEHGRLIKRGKTLAKINLGPTIVEILSYESPKKKGYESLSQLDQDEDVDAHKRDSFQIVKGQLPDDNCTLLPCPSVGRNVVQGGMVKVDIPANLAVLCKTTLDVMGICCPSEVPLIKKLLDPLPGVEEVSVNVTAKTVLVLHDQLVVTDVQLGASSNLMSSPTARCNPRCFSQFHRSDSIFECFAWSNLAASGDRLCSLFLYSCSEGFEWSTFGR